VAVWHNAITLVGSSGIEKSKCRSVNNAVKKSRRGKSIMPENSYKNLRVREQTFDRLKDEKKEFETWDGLLHRLVGNGDD